MVTTLPRVGEWVTDVLKAPLGSHSVPLVGRILYKDPVRIRKRANRRYAVRERAWIVSFVRRLGHDRLVCRLVADWWAASELRPLRDTSASARPANERTVSAWRIGDVHSFPSAAFITRLGYGPFHSRNSPVCFSDSDLIVSFPFVGRIYIDILNCN